ncbi:MAG: type II secretion system protein GspK [Proteobacteria bacterium]|nr:type II secretion system protein GspK [Pseudomonadota bacterium]MCL2307819.1 type II secretion system protein GspK [Pseudomonadota bacterium]
MLPATLRSRLKAARNDAALLRGFAASREKDAFRQRGIALIIVLWTTVLLTVIAAGFAFSMRNEALATQNAVSAAAARWIANGAVERTVYELATPRLALEDAWQPDGRTHTWQEGEARIEVKAVDEGAYIDLNTGSDMLLKGLFVRTGGLDEIAATNLVDSVVNWRTEGDVKRIGGAKEADYRKAGLPYGPANAPFEAVEEFGMVLGVTPELYGRLSPFLTVNSRQSSVNPRTAPREVLLAFLNVTEEMVDEYLARRQEALANRQPLPPFPGGGGGRAPAWRIEATVTMEDGTQFTRKAVIRRTGNPKRPFVALLWGEA